jgi:uncharacterized protein (TIGR03382 family)
VKHRLRRLCATTAVLALPVLAIPVWTAAAASAAPVAPAASCPNGNPNAPNPNGSVEGLIGNVSPAPGSTVTAGSTVTFLVGDEQPFPNGPSFAGDAVVTVNGASVTTSIGAQESGVPITYANPNDKGSQSTNCEIPVSATLPSTVNGSTQVCATAYDGDNNQETVCWVLTATPGTPVPVGTIGGVGLAAVAGLVLFVIQLRRRRHVTPTQV